MDKSKEYETLVVILTGLIVVYWFKRYDSLLVVAGGLGILALLFPVVVQGIHWGWMKLSLLLGQISGKVLLTIVYVFVLLPLSFFARRMGKLTMQLKEGSGSFFKTRNHTYDKEDLIHPW